MDIKNIIASIFGLAVAFLSGDYMDAIEPNEHTHLITEKCEVVREITKEN
jgi:hypothetical protein